MQNRKSSEITRESGNGFHNIDTTLPVYRSFIIDYRLLMRGLSSPI